MCISCIGMCTHLQGRRLVARVPQANKPRLKGGPLMRLHIRLPLTDGIGSWAQQCRQILHARVANQAGAAALHSVRSAGSAAASLHGDLVPAGSAAQRQRLRALTLSVQPASHAKHTWNTRA